MDEEGNIKLSDFGLAKSSKAAYIFVSKQKKLVNAI